MSEELIKRLREMLPQSPFAPTENFPPYQAAAIVKGAGHD